VGALQHLKELVLFDAPLTTASYLNPLPPNLTKLTFEKQLYISASVDLSAAFSKHTQHPYWFAVTRQSHRQQQLADKWRKPAVPARLRHAT
jgi:hypothetical protein